jgi:hypothetical protein
MTPHPVPTDWPRLSGDQNALAPVWRAASLVGSDGVIFGSAAIALHAHLTGTFELAREPADVDIYGDATAIASRFLSAGYVRIGPRELRLPGPDELVVQLWDYARRTQPAGVPPCLTYTDGLQAGPTATHLASLQDLFVMKRSIVRTDTRKRARDQLDLAVIEDLIRGRWQKPLRNT